MCFNSKLCVRFILICTLISFVSIYYTFGQNLLKTVAIQYKVRSKIPDDDLSFKKVIPFNKVNNYEVIVGVERTTIQPVAYIQNVSDKQLTFKTIFKILNNDKNKLIYNRKAPVSQMCLSVHDSDSEYCSGDPNISVRYCSILEKENKLEVTYLPFPGDVNLTGIPPNGFVEINYPPFEPNDLFDNHYGNCTASLIIDPTNPENELSLGESDYSDDTLKVNLILRKPFCAELFYPEDRDTIDSQQNWLYGLSNITKNANFHIEISRNNDFAKIDTTINKLIPKNVKLETGTKYYWRLITLTADSTCVSDIHSFYTSGPTDVDEVIQNNISIYPNPARDYIQIKSSEGSDIQIFDMLGINMINVGTRHALSLRIDVSFLSPGIYFIKIGNRVEKFVRM